MFQDGGCKLFGWVDEKDTCISMIGWLHHNRANSCTNRYDDCPVQ